MSVLGSVSLSVLCLVLRVVVCSYVVVGLFPVVVVSSLTLSFVVPRRVLGVAQSGYVCGKI